MKTWLGIALLSFALPASAMSWQDLWLRADQQAMRLLQKGQAQPAARTFRDPQWQAVADYRAGDYLKAAQQFATLSAAEADYNRGNALALQGDYPGAIAAYETVLKKNPQHRDAAYNRDIIKKRLQQQQNQQQSQQQQSDPSSAKQDQQSAQQSKEQQNKASSNPHAPSKPPKPIAAPNKQSTAESSPPKKTSQQQHPANEKPAEQAQPEHASTTNTSPQGNAKKVPADKESAHSQQQANEQWLRQIPDDPGGLLREKFLRDHERMRQ